MKLYIPIFMPQLNKKPVNIDDLRFDKYYIQDEIDMVKWFMPSLYKEKHNSKLITCYVYELNEEEMAMFDPLKIMKIPLYDEHVYAPNVRRIKADISANELFGRDSYGNTIYFKRKN